MVFEASGGDVWLAARRKKHSQRWGSIRTSTIIHITGANIIDANPERSNRAIAKYLQVSEGPICNVVHEDIRYTSYRMSKGQFMSGHTQDRPMVAPRRKMISNQIKRPRGTWYYFFSNENIFGQDQNEKRINDR